MYAVAAPALAASDCEPPTGAPPLAWALAHEAACHQAVSGFNRYLGRLLNQAGRYLQAVDRLEAAVMEDPDDWAARLEYAIALAGSGDALAATSLLRQLAQDPAVPASKRDEIAALLSSPMPPVAPARPLNRLTIGVSLDDNLLGSISQNGFELTLPDGRLPVALSAADRPRSGAALLAEYRRADDLALPEGQWRYALLAGFRQVPGLPAANLGRLDLQLERHPSEGAGLFAELGFQYLARGGKSQRRQWRLTLANEHRAGPAGACRMREGARLQAATYPRVPVLGGWRLGPMVQLSCETLYAELRAWRDWPLRHGRPGGEQDGLGLRVARQWRLPQGRLTLEYEHLWRRDRKGYSPLLEYGARRTLDLDVARLEYSWPARFFARDIRPFVAVDWLRQRANIPLFGLRNRVLSAGLQIDW